LYSPNHPHQTNERLLHTVMKKIEATASLKKKGAKLPGVAKKE
jgi:hypothetical protein